MSRILNGCVYIITVDITEGPISLTNIIHPELPYDKRPKREFPQSTRLCMCLCLCVWSMEVYAYVCVCLCLRTAVNHVRHGLKSSSFNVLKVT